MYGYEQPHEYCGLCMGNGDCGAFSPRCTETCALYDEDEQECIIYTAAAAAKEYFKQKNDVFLGKDDEE